MSYQLDCFDNIIGLSRTECECYDDGKPADFDTTLSGLYLDELYPITAYSGFLDCENGNDIWQMLDRARDQAILGFRADINAVMLKDNRLKRKPFKGKIGKIKYTKEEVITTGDWVGIRIVCDDVVGGKLKIKNIGTLFSETGTFDLYIYNNMNEIVDIVSLDTTANTHKINDITDIELDLHDDYVENLEYFLIYQKTPLLNPKDTNLFDESQRRCGMGSQTNKQYGWQEWSKIDKFLATDISDLSDVTGTGSCETSGLTLSVDFTCSVEDIWCDEDELDFSAGSTAMAMAYAIRYKAGELFFYNQLLSTNVNYNSLVNGDGMKAAQEHFSEEYLKALENIGDNIDITMTDCYECADRIPLRRILLKS